MVLTSLKQMLVFTKQLYIFPRCKERSQKSHYYFSCRKGKVSNQPHPLCVRGPSFLTEDMLCGTDSQEWMDVEEVQQLVFHALFLTITFFKAFCCCPSSLFALHSCNKTVIELQRAQKSQSPGMVRDKTRQKPTKRCSTWAVGRHWVCQSSLGLQHVQQCAGGQAGLHSSSDESTCHFCESRHSLLVLSLPLRIPRPWFTAGAVKDSLRLHSRKKYKGSSIQKHLIKYPFKPHADLQEGSEWPSGGFYLPISTGQCRVHAQSLGWNCLHSPMTSFKSEQGTAPAPGQQHPPISIHQPP